MFRDRTEIAGVVVADATQPGFPLTYVSPGFETLTGYASAQVLGRSCSLLQGPETDPRAVDQVFDWFRWVDATFSTYRVDSEISRLNSGELTLAEVHFEVRQVLERFEALSQATDGFFELRTDHLPVPVKRVSGLTTSSGVDPSGLVKGWENSIRSGQGDFPEISRKSPCPRLAAVGLT